MAIGPIILSILSGVALVWMSGRRILKGGSCCGSSEKPEKKVRVSDRNPKHYQYHYIADVEGIVCGNCVRRVENAFNSQEGIYAKADLENKTIKVYSHRKITFDDARRYLDNLPYTLMDIREGI